MSPKSGRCVNRLFDTALVVETNHAIELTPQVASRALAAALVKRELSVRSRARNSLTWSSALGRGVLVIWTDEMA